MTRGEGHDAFHDADAGGGGRYDQEKITDREPTQTVPAVKGTANERKLQIKIPISKTLVASESTKGRSRLRGFSGSAPRPSEISEANEWARASLKYSRWIKGLMMRFISLAIFASASPRALVERYPR